MAATFQRVSGGRLLLNVVTGGDDAEQRRFGDHLGKEERYARAGEFLAIVRALWDGEPVDFSGEHYEIADAQIVPAPGVAGPVLRRVLGRRHRGGGGAGRRVPHLGRAARAPSPRRSAASGSAPPSLAASCGSASACT